jgi:signal transduction histidine kinase
MADEEKLTMAITNIIENAIKYNYENGLVNITLEIDPYLKNSARLSIADTGIGIPKESLPKIFSKFYRAENAQKLEPNGSGLGLYITKNIIEKHGGKIHIESQEKRGTTFIINIPINISPETK